MSSVSRHHARVRSVDGAYSLASCLIAAAVILLMAVMLAGLTATATSPGPPQLPLPQPAPVGP